MYWVDMRLESADLLDLASWRLEAKLVSGAEL